MLLEQHFYVWLFKVANCSFFEMDGQAAESGGLTSENDSALSKDENYQFDENMQVFKS